jgi:hypothetical protein
MPNLSHSKTEESASSGLVGLLNASPGSPLRDAKTMFTAGASTVIIQDDLIEARFDAGTGALVGLRNKKTSWEAQQRPELGRSFRAFLATPDDLFNPVEGNLAALTELKLDDDGRGIRLHWKGFKTASGQTFPVELEGHVKVQNGELHFSGTVYNQSNYRLDTISWPMIGDLTRPPGDKILMRENFDYGTLRRTPLYPQMKNERGYWGTNYPMQMEGKGPTAPVITGGLHFIQRFILLASETQGLYLGVHDRTAKRMVCFGAELRPGWTDSFHCLAPDGPAIDGLPVHLITEVIHYPFAAANETMALPEIVLAFYQGDWQAGVQPYCRWRQESFTPVNNPGWTKEVHSWQQLQIGGAEDDLRTPFSELAKRAKVLAENGVTALQLVGWNHGGQDRGNPSHDPDPRLGSWDELKAAIREIESTGVRVILFNKYVWADITRPNYPELKSCAAVDPHGIPYQHPGYEYQTPVQLMSINTRRFTVACLNDERWIDLCLNEFNKSIDLGASGILYDEAFHHWSATHCFSEHHGHRAPATLWSGDLRLAQRFCDVVRNKLGAEKFLLAAEAPFDLEEQYYGLSYFRILPGHIPVERFIDPFYPIMIAVCGFDDREMINRALLYRYIISYEPFNFKGDLTDFPLTLEYGKKIDSLRRRYADYLWKAAYRHHDGVTVSRGLAALVDYGVFVQPTTGKRAVVLISDTRDANLAASIDLAEPGAFVLVTPEDPEPRPCDLSRVPIKARSAAVLLEGLERW